MDPLVHFFLLGAFAKFAKSDLRLPDAASIAAHYGSVSVVTSAVATAYLYRREIAYESHMPLFVALL